MSGWQPTPATALLILDDGTRLEGRGIGAVGHAAGEVCFNTAMTGYQEILTDPSYAGQIVTFTFPHIGNAGTNDEDIETVNMAALSGVRGVVLKADITNPANYRAAERLDAWLKKRNIVGVTGIDTRALTARIRANGMPNGVVAHSPDGYFHEPSIVSELKNFPGLEGLDLAKEVTTGQTYKWDQTPWKWDEGYGTEEKPDFHIVAVDYGAKRNILRQLADEGARITVVPATATAKDILAHNPDGIFLSNGPGDPAATGKYAVPTIKSLMDAGKPIFGICLGHQLLGLALGGATAKMHQGHHGANHPVKDLTTGKVEITSMNHGFAVVSESLPPGVTQTHVSLFDGSNAGLSVNGKPIFSVQYHPEASPGPHDSHYLFTRFVNQIRAQKGVSAKPEHPRSVQA
jgi:carbamoyl-phosphate synthase small subunit